MSSAVIKPRRLSVGDKIGIIAPGSPVTLTDEVIDRAYCRLNQRGFAVEEAPQCRKVVGHTAGHPEDRAEAIHSFFSDPEVKAIMAFWGGYQSHQVLEYLNFDLIRENPKILVGYSDITALSLGIFTQTSLVGFSGPAALTFVKPHMFDYTWRVFEKVLIHPEPHVSFQASEQWSDNPWFERQDQKMILEPTPEWKAFKPGKVNGRCVVGNLGTMLLLAGTPYWPDLSGRILIVEEDDVEKPETIDRLFTQLRQMGVYDQIAGLVVGSPRAVAFSDNDSLEAILQLALRGYDFPVLINVDYGHTDPILTLPTGIEMEVDADQRKITLLEPSVV